MGWVKSDRQQQWAPGGESAAECHAVDYIPVRCPDCRSKRCPVYATREKIVRYHKCRACGCNFKSVERED